MHVVKRIIVSCIRVITTPPLYTPSEHLCLLGAVGIPQSNGQWSSACQGDSGSPQVVPGTNTQVSIVSYGPTYTQDCGKGSWGASTSVYSYLNFINGIMTQYGSPAFTPGASPSSSTLPPPPIASPPSVLVAL